MPEIQCVIGLTFFQISDLTFVASEFKILFLQCSNLLHPLEIAQEFVPFSLNPMFCPLFTKVFYSNGAVSDQQII